MKVNIVTVANAGEESGKINLKRYPNNLPHQ
jgi:hypothetical protein